MVQPRPERKIRSVALDTSSRTSVVLAKLLLELKMGLQPEYVPHVPDLDSMLQSCDAAVLIGDKALRISRKRYRITDLAEAWTEWQQLPFVFAFWACRHDLPLPADLPAIFRRAKEHGLAARPRIAASYARALGLTQSFLLSYLSDNVDYDLGPRHIEGLVRFYDLARARDLIPGLKPVRFLNAHVETPTP
jgi:chorismate dehydratase